MICANARSVQSGWLSSQHKHSTHCLQRKWHTTLCLALNWLRDSGSLWLCFCCCIMWHIHTKNLSYSHRWLLLLSTQTCHTCHTRYTRRWRKWRLQGPVGTLCMVQVGWGGWDWVSVTNVLRMQELTLVGHDLCCLLAVQNREVGGHVDIYAGIWWEAARSLGAQNGGWSRAGVWASGGRWGWRTRRGGCARLTRGGAPWGHHRDGLQETPTPGGRFLFGSETTTAAHCDHWAQQNECHEDWPHN